MALLSRSMQLVKPCRQCAPFSPAQHGPSLIARRPMSVRSASMDSQAPAQSAQAEPAAVQAPMVPSTFEKAEYIENTEFNLSKISFGTILTPLGVFLLSYGFGAYFLLLPGADIAALMLVYGFPITILGFALSYAQLDPVPLKSSKKALELRESQMTVIQQQVREDTTRFRYGDDQHLDEALLKIFKLGRSGGLPRREVPCLVGLREEVVGSAYTLVLEFMAGKLDKARWDEFQPKIQAFFGPGIVAEVQMSSKPGYADVLLISDGSGTGRGADERKDPLMPLYPGFAARKQ